MNQLPKKIMLLVASSLISILCLELLYRVYTYRQDFHVVAQKEANPSFAVWEKSPVVYHSQYGFDHRKDTVLQTAWIDKGKFSGCNSVSYNKYGNQSGTTFYKENPDFRIAVFGDSFVNSYSAGAAWPEELSLLIDKKLSEVNGPIVEVVNYGRAGFGVLQMFDMAADQLEKEHFDLAIIAFITNDLHRARHWWYEARVEDSPITRVFRSGSKDVKTDLIKGALSDALIVNSVVSQDFCDNLPKFDIVSKLIAQFNQIKAQNLSPYDVKLLMSPKVSFLYSKFVLNDKYAQIKERLPKAWQNRSGYAPIRTKSFNEDAKFLLSANKLKETGTEIILMHTPVVDEIKNGQLNYVTNKNAQSLMTSLEMITGKKIQFLEEEMKIDASINFKDLVLNYDAGDHHPNAAGNKLIAEAALRTLEKNGLIPVP